MRYPKLFRRAVTRQDAAQRTSDRLCAGRARGVFRARFRGRLGPRAGRHRPQRLRQDLAAAADRGPAGAGRRIGRAGRRRGRTDAARTGPLSRPSRRAETGAQRAGKPVVLAGFSRRGRQRSRRKPRQSGARARHASAGGVSVGRPAAPAVDRPAARGAAAGLAAGRADLGARCRRAGSVRRPDARPPRERRHHRRRHPCAARDRGEGIADGGPA